MLKKLMAWISIIGVVVICSAMTYQNSPFRLHVLANSNSAIDQKVKLCVRDEVLKLAETALADCTSSKEAEKQLSLVIPSIEKRASDVLRENGFNYSAKAYVGEFNFPQKDYAGVVYDEGKYHALRVVLGEGNGDNWWCVMFPPLCIVNTNEQPGGELEYKSAIVEFFSKLFTGG